MSYVHIVSKLSGRFGDGDPLSLPVPQIWTELFNLDYVRQATSKCHQGEKPYIIWWHNPRSHSKSTHTTPRVQPVQSVQQYLNCKFKPPKNSQRLCCRRKVTLSWIRNVWSFNTFRHFEQFTLPQHLYWMGWHESFKFFLKSSFGRAGKSASFLTNCTQSIFLSQKHFFRKLSLNDTVF